jgi:hypothetical protein
MISHVQLLQAILRMVAAVLVGCIVVWAGALLYVLARGPGELSLDALIRRKFR